jgi:8-hydroxy-5-deazaflavin:NADPH oxidoreductase
MTTLTIIGTGNMGTAIAAALAKGGHQVQSLGQSDADVAVTGDVVVLAVPYAALTDIVAQRGESLAGRTVVDLTNPVDFATMDALTVPADSSAAAELTAALPDSHVLKAFNTNFASTLASGSVGPLDTTVLVAGDEDQAKTAFAEVLVSSGLKAVDAGPLKRARELEALGFLQITLAAREKVAWTDGFGLVA